MKSKEFKKVEALLKKYSLKVCKSKTSNSVYFTLADDSKSMVRLSDHLGNSSKYFLNIVMMEKTGTCIIECRCLKINAYEKECVTYLKHILYLFEPLVNLNLWAASVNEVSKEKCTKIIKLQSELNTVKQALENYKKETTSKMSKYNTLFNTINGLVKSFNK